MIDFILAGVVNVLITALPAQNLAASLSNDCPHKPLAAIVRRDSEAIANRLRFMPARIHPQEIQQRLNVCLAGLWSHGEFHLHIG